MTQVTGRRLRWKVDDEIVEQDAYCCTPVEWDALVAERPCLAKWGVFHFPALGLVTAVSFPLGVIAAGQRHVDI